MGAACRPTRAYAERRAEGLNKKEIIRCLKCYIAREVYSTLRADLTALAPATTPTPRIITINRHAGPVGVTRKSI